MSVFISYNYQTGHAAAMALNAELQRHGIEAWWLPDSLLFNQLDQTIERALTTCQRCIVIWSKPKLSDWQRTEIEAIRQRLLMRQPPADTIDFFMVLRDSCNPKILAQRHLPMLDCAEYLDYEATGNKMPDLTHLAGYVPSASPLMVGDGQQPYFHKIPDAHCAQGRQAFTGGFKPSLLAATTKQYCWLFLEDKKGRWYLQQPRPTFTHAHRWISPAVYLGENIAAVVLVAASAAAHEKIVASLLAGKFGALAKREIGKVTVLDRLLVNPKPAAEPTTFEEA